MTTIAREVIHEEEGAYVARTILIWDGLTKVDDARYAVEPVTDPEWQPESCDACEAKDGEICDLEEARDGFKSDLEDQVYRWRERCKATIKIARKMIAEREEEIGKANMRTAKLLLAVKNAAKPKAKPANKR